MTPMREDDWSDSDEEILPEVETSVLLGLPDGPIESVIDITDVAVSRIGGQPAFLPSKEPPFSSSCCKNCSSPSELLVQVWCPIEDSPMDRALYIWGCARAGCQGKEGSYRAWRGLRLNNDYAAKLAQKLAKTRQRAEIITHDEAARKKQLSVSNPFSMRGVPVSSPIGLGSRIFSGDIPTSGLVAQPLGNEPSNDESDLSTSLNDASLITVLASTTIVGSEWESAPSYTALYLSTASEYLPPPPKGKLLPDAEIQDPDDNGKEHKVDASWMFEAYENSLEIDHVFERFTQRVAHEAEQCIRYELNGIPLPFASDDVFDALFPAPPASLLPVTKHDIRVVRTPKRMYNASSIPLCPVCESRRIFEVQLMPNLINILTKQGEKKKVMTDEERTKAVEKALMRGGGVGEIGMEWGTCMVFSCEKDCCLDDGGQSEVQDCWREEVVLVQWDT